MHAEPALRMAAPMMALEAAGPLRSRVQLHLATALAQDEIRAAAPGLGMTGTGPYEPDRGSYLPLCGLLDRDVAGSPSLVEYGVGSPLEDTARFHHRYRITDGGRRRLRSMMAGAGPGAEAAARRTGEICGGMPVALLEWACGRRGPEGGAGSLEGEVRAGLARVLPRIRRKCSEFGSMNAIFVGGMLEVVEEALSKAITGSGPQDRVVLCVSGEVIRTCAELDAAMAPDADTDALDPRVADANDLVGNLMLYCEAKGLMRDPLSRPLCEVLSVEKAKMIFEGLFNQKEWLRRGGRRPGRA